MKKKIIIIAAAVIAVSLMVVVLLRWWDDPDADNLRVSGNIELTEVKIAFKMAGKLIALAVDEGEPVTRGAVVAELDQDQLTHQCDAALAAQAAAESGLAQLFTAIAYQREVVESQIDLGQADLNSATAQLDKFLAGSRTQEIKQAKAAVQEAQAQFERAGSDWQRAQSLYQSQTISAAQYDQVRTAYESARAMFTRAKEQRDLVVEGPRQEDVAMARAQVARAEAGLRAARANRLELTRREQELSLRRAEIERAKAQVALVESQLKDTYGVSPIDGVVLVKAAEPGEILAPGTTVLTIGDLDHPWLRGYINEQDLGRVKLGQPVRVTTDSYPGKVYEGRIGFIASEAEFTPKQIQTTEERVKLVYRIKIDIANPQHELKLNMPADAVIEVQGSGLPVQGSTFKVREGS